MKQVFGIFFFFYEQKDNKNSSKSFFGLKNDKMPPVIKELENFEKKNCSNWYQKQNFKKAFI